ncbi:ATP-dependent RNA helicase, partial [Trypanosoma cruzi]
AVDEDLHLTEFGRLMAEFPVDACLARMLIRSAEHRCGADAAVIAAMLEAGNVYVRPSGRGNEADQQHITFQHPDGDHLTLFNVFHAFWRNNQSPQYCFDHFLRYHALLQATRVYAQLTKLMGKKSIPVVSTYDDKTRLFDSVALRKTVLEGFFTQVAYKSPSAEHYKTVKDSQLVALHIQSVLSKKKRPPWIVYDRLEVHGKEGTFIRFASVVEPEWLLVVSDFFTDPAELSDGEICHILQRLKKNDELNLSSAHP